ncbi:hypothetical protein NW733_03850 [Mycoplasmopsis felis]|uniref:hypothetical protein n=1 Tax=Mycoplasmopsis felis TaxID=33923 RepID=UPI0021E0E15B|nr:hypothetical protein [Mycoplasmopsis felis]MCU9931795.1 hypothetical protein [Mycoplasmopsis felis]MCU9937746.1 hypothetical protein [Mycoplasmopsis felis]
MVCIVFSVTPGTETLPANFANWIAWLLIKAFAALIVVLFDFKLLLIASNSG